MVTEIGRELWTSFSHKISLDNFKCFLKYENMFVIAYLLSLGLEFVNYAQNLR